MRRWRRSVTGRSEPKVRRAVERDLDVLAELWTALSEHHERVDPVFVMRRDSGGAVRQLVAVMLRDPDAALFVSETEVGGISGFVAVQVDRAPPILVERERAEVTDLMVREDARRRGVGRTLVERAFRWVADRGLDRCEVRVAVGNPQGQAFWRAMGFDDLMDVLARRL